MKKDVRCCNCLSGLNVLEFAFFVFRIHHAFPIKMLDMDCKNAENLTFFYDGRTFRRQCVNRIDAT